MTKEERNQVIFQLSMITGMNDQLLKSLSDNELKKLHRDRIESKSH